ncbi:MAG: putative quinol monooxygenase [Pseudohongiellaceae bacterium]
MSYVVSIDFQCKTGLSPKVKELLTVSLSDTRSFEGCQALEVYLDESKECFTAIETWDSAEHYRNYLQWRTDSGIANVLEQLLEDGWPGALNSIKWLGPKLEI